MIKLVLFDLDGVLIDSKENMRCAWIAVKKKFNLKQSFENYFNSVGLPFFVILKKIGIKHQKTHIKEVRVKAAKRRAIECLEDVRSLKQDGLDCGNVKQKLTKLKIFRFQN